MKDKLTIETNKIGCKKKLHYSIKSGCNRYCGENFNGNLYLCKICKLKEAKESEK